MLTRVCSSSGGWREAARVSGDRDSRAFPFAHMHSLVVLQKRSAIETAVRFLLVRTASPLCGCSFHPDTVTRRGSSVFFTSRVAPTLDQNVENGMGRAKTRTQETRRQKPGTNARCSGSGSSSGGDIQRMFCSRSSCIVLMATCVGEQRTSDTYSRLVPLYR